MNGFANQFDMEAYARAIMRRAGVPGAVADGVVREWGAFSDGPAPMADGRLTWAVGGERADLYAAWLCALARGSRYVDAPALMLDLKGLDAYGADSMASRFSAMRGASLLALAGLDATRWTRPRLELLTDLVTVRARERRGTVIASSRGLRDTVALLARTTDEEHAGGFRDAVLRAMGGSGGALDRVVTVPDATGAAPLPGSPPDGTPAPPATGAGA